MRCALPLVVWAMLACGAGDRPEPSKLQDGRGEAPKEFMGLPLLIDENFEKERKDRWEVTDPSAWEYRKDGDRHVFALTKNSDYEPEVRSPRSIAMLRKLHVSDFVMDAWVRSTQRPMAHRDLCFFFGHQSPKNFYYAHLGQESDPHSNTIMLVDGKPRTSIAKTRNEGTEWTDGYHHVRVVRKVRTGEIKVYFDDMNEPAMTAEDATFKWGRVGIGSFDDPGNFDRVVLWGRKVDPPDQARSEDRKADAVDE